MRSICSFETLIYFPSWKFPSFQRESKIEYPSGSFYPSRIDWLLINVEIRRTSLFRGPGSPSSPMQIHKSSGTERKFMPGTWGWRSISLQTVSTKRGKAYSRADLHKSADTGYPADDGSVTWGVVTQTETISSYLRAAWQLERTESAVSLEGD